MWMKLNEYQNLKITFSQHIALYITLSRDVPLLISEFLVGFWWTFLKLQRNLVHEDIHVD